MSRLLIPAVLVGALLACGEAPPPAPTGPVCELTVDTLADKVFVESKILADRSETPDPMARVKFVKKDDGLHALYTVKNGLHVYDYVCGEGARPGEIKCVTKPDLKRVCLAFEVNADGSCTPEAIAALGFGVPFTDEEITKTAEEVRKLVAEAKAGSAWDAFKITYNNVANALQGLFFVKVDSAKCRIVVDDMMMTVHDGKKKEDYNPIGTNPFVPATEEYLFEDCTSEGWLLDLDEPALPAKMEDVPRVRNHATGKEMFYHYAGDKDLTPVEGCTYTIDTWATWRPVQKGQAVEVVDGKLQWKTAHTWPADTGKVLVGIEAGQALMGGFFHLARRKTCGGATETIDVLCNATRLE